MAIYFANAIIEGRMKYEAVFTINLYLRYQDDVDAILVAEGKEDLIKR